MNVRVVIRLLIMSSSLVEWTLALVSTYVLNLQYRLLLVKLVLLH
jgi:hypothetical protein